MDIARDAQLSCYLKKLCHYYVCLLSQNMWSSCKLSIKSLISDLNTFFGITKCCNTIPTTLPCVLLFARERIKRHKLRFFASQLRGNTRFHYSSEDEGQKLISNNWNTFCIKNSQQNWSLNRSSLL
jgi:hypothetical protein